MNKVTIKTAVRIQITCMAATYNLFPSLSRYFCGMIPDQPTTVLRGHQGAVYDLAWNAHAQCWHSAGGDGVVATWALGEEDGVAAFQHAAPFYSVTVWGEAVVGGNSSGELFVKTAEGSSTLRVHNAPVFSLWVDAQNRLWSGDGAGVICSWSWSAGRPELLTQRPTSLGKVRHLTEHHQGLLASGGSGEWTVLDDQGTPVMGAHAHDRSCYWACHLASKDVVLSGGQDGQLKVHRQGEEWMSLDVHQSAVYRAVVHRGVVWTAGRDKDVKAWSADTLDALGKLTRPHARSVNAMAVGGPDGSLLATAGDDRTVKVWTLEGSPLHD